MLRDFKFQHIINQIQLHAIIREMNVKIFNEKKEFHELSYDRFKNLLVQMAVFAYPELSTAGVALE